MSECPGCGSVVYGPGFKLIDICCLDESEILELKADEEYCTCECWQNDLNISDCEYFKLVQERKR